MKKTEKMKGNYEDEAPQKKLELLLMFFIGDVKKNMEELLEKDDLELLVKETLEKTYSSAYFAFEEAKKILDVKIETKIL